MDLAGTDAQEEDDQTLQHSAFEVLRDMPNPASDRVQKAQAARGVDPQQLVLQEHLLAAFSLSEKGEDREYQQQRLDACQACWDSLASHMEVSNAFAGRSSQTVAVLAATDQQTFATLMEFVATQHQRSLDAEAGARGRRRLPTALTFAGGVNSADHAKTFPTLAQLLRDQGCHVALLQSGCLGAGTGVALALNAIMRQFSGRETDADDLLALQAWYRDALAGTAPMHPSTAAAAGLDLMSSPLGRLQLQSPDWHTQSGPATGAAATGITQGARQQPADSDPQGRELESSHRSTQEAPATSTAAGSRTRGTRQQPADSDSQSREGQADAESAAAADGVLSPLERLRLQTPATARVRPPTRALTIGEAAAAVRPRNRPLVVMLEGAEGTGASALKDLIILLAEVHSQLPVVLVMGMSTSAAALQQLLPLAVVDLLEAQHFHLVRSLPRLQALMRDVLMGPKFHGIFFGHQVIKFINTHFMEHDFTTAVFRKGLQVACIAHFQSAPLSFLAAECIQADAQPADMSSPSLQLTAGAGKQRRARKRRAEEDEESRQGSPYTLHELYEWASGADALTGDRRETLQHLEGAVKRLSAEACVKLLEALVAKIRRESPTKATKLKSPAGNNGPRQQLVAAAPRKQAARRAPTGEAARKMILSTTVQGNMAKAKAREQASASRALASGWAEQVSQLLHNLAVQALSAPPGLTPGAAVLCCERRRSDLRCLTAAPRQTIHEALSAPHKYMGISAQMGMSADSEDACIAYQLFLEDGETINVAEWFHNFCLVCNNAGVLPEAAERVAATGPCKRHIRPSRKVLQRDEPKDDDPAGTLGVAGAAVKRGQGACSDVQEAAVRFSQATRELQLLGLLRPARKRHGEHAQKMVWHSGHATRMHD
eukprot:jgi/Astpho2/7571/Aster-02477